MTGQWVVVLEAVGSNEAPVGGQLLDRLLEQVRDCDPSALHTTGRYALQLLVAAGSGLEAHSIAVDRWRRAVTAIGAPVWPAVRVEVLTLDEFEREWAAAGFGEGSSAIAPTASCAADSDRLLRSVFEDPLTHLPTGEPFRARVEATMRQAYRPGTSHGLLLMQLMTRATPGSARGDAGAIDDVVILDVARQLAGAVRRDDIMARVDRGTFAVLIKGIAAEDAAALARRASSAATDACDTGEDRRVTGRAGIALSKPGWDADRLFAAAAHALRSAQTAPDGWALFRADVSGPAKLRSDVFGAESCADEC